MREFWAASQTPRRRCKSDRARPRRSDGLGSGVETRPSSVVILGISLCLTPQRPRGSRDPCPKSDATNRARAGTGRNTSTATGRRIKAEAPDQTPIAPCACTTLTDSSSTDCCGLRPASLEGNGSASCSISFPKRVDSPILSRRVRVQIGARRRAGAASDQKELRHVRADLLSGASPASRS